MSKSLDNYVGFMDQPEDMFGKIMSISDAMMDKYIQYLGVLKAEQIDSTIGQLKNGSLHPMEAKKQLAQATVTAYWNKEDGVKAREHFETVFSQKKLPDHIDELKVSAANEQGLWDVLELSIQAGFSSSRSEARRILKQNGMKINETTITTEKISLPANEQIIFRQGKRKIIKLIKS